MEYDLNDLYGRSSSSNPFDILGNMFGNAMATGVIMIVCTIIALAGGIVLYFTFLSKKNENRFDGFWGWLYEFLNFKSMFAEGLLKVIYIIYAIQITLSAFGVLIFTEGGSIGAKLLAFLLYIIVGNVILRLIFEFLLVALVICRNTTEINKKMGQFGNMTTSRPEQIHTSHNNEIGVVFCRNCGNKFSSSDIVCPLCGAKKV